MITLLTELVAHKAHANAAILTAVGTNAAAAQDSEILGLLHHIMVANRFWICVIRGEPFEADREMASPRTMPALQEAFRQIAADEVAWLAEAPAADGERVVSYPLIPGGACTVAEAFTQVCMHSHGHRAQLAKLLRGHGIQPPAGDFILWLIDRKPPDWGGEPRA
jgi:uncharacterized damage-inducible protein DinB